MAAASQTEAVFRAVSDPTRRAIIDLLAQGERAVRDLCGRFKLTQPAISQHLRVLREAKLVRVRRLGRLRLYRLRAAPLKDVYDWAGHYERFWTERLQALGGVLDTMDDRSTGKRQ